MSASSRHGRHIWAPLLTDMRNRCVPLTAIARDHKQAELASQRSSAHPTTQAHEAKMTGMRQARLATMKANSELEQQVYRLQGELERLQQELKDEEAEAVDALELDSEMSVLLSFLEGVPQPPLTFPFLPTQSTHQTVSGYGLPARRRGGRNHLQDCRS